MKSKIYLTGVLASALVVFSFSSCEKEDGDNTQPQKSRIDNSKSNSQNSKSADPYAIYGVSHNNAMDYVAAHSSFDSLDKQQVFNHLKTYSDSNFDFSGGTTYSDLLNAINYTDDLFSDIENAGNKLYLDGRIDSSMINIAQEFFDVFANAGDTNDISPISVTDFTNDINAFENYLDSNYTVTYDEVTKIGNFPALLLAASSVAKSSYSYWTNVEADSLDPWHGQNERRGRHAGHGGFFHALGVAAVDVGGFFGGGDQWNGDGGTTNFNFGKAWRHAGSQSSSY